MAEGRMSIEGRLSVDGRGSVLVRRNREVAEVREELLQMEQRLDAAQGRNHVLLEETSVLDSTIFEHSGRAATCESQLADLMQQAREREDKLSKQRAAGAAETAALNSQVAEREDKLRHAEADLETKRESISVFDDEILKLQGLLEAENTTLAHLRRARQEPFLDVTQKYDTAEAAALRAVEEELSTMRAQHTAHEEDTASVRQRCERLEADLAAERQRREEVSGSLRRAVVEQAEGPKRIHTAEAAIAARGGDSQAVLVSLRGTMKTGGSAVAAGANAGSERVAQLRSELQASEDQCKSLKAALETQKEQDAQAAARLSAQLDGARGELQRSLKEAADAHSSEVAKFEQEIQAERQRAADQEVAHRICYDQITQLKATRTRAHDERGCAIVRAQAEAGRCAALIEELQRVQGEVSSAEGRLVAIQERITQAEQQRSSAQDEGRHRAAKVRSTIEALWQGLRVARVDATSGGRATAMY